MYLRKLMCKSGIKGETIKFRDLEEEELINLFENYDKLIHKYSVTIKGFDSDLYSECKIVFFKCIKNFEFQEKQFRKIFYSYK